MPAGKNFLTIALVFLVIAFFTSICYAVPAVINYQGQLNGISGPVTDTLSMTFRIFDVGTSGVGIPLWQEDQNVSVSQGIYSVLLGTGTINPDYGTLQEALLSSDDLWLEVQIASEVMAPRHRITSVGFAIRAGEADTIRDGAITTVKLEDSAVNTDKLLDDAVTSAKIVDGTITATDIDDGSDSGLDADLLDSHDSRYFATSEHLHDSRYINTTGDTMTGSLSVDDSLSIGTDTPDDDDTIYMDDGSELFRWKEDLDDNETNGIDGGFNFSDDIDVDGNITIGNNVSHFKYKSPRSLIHDMPASAFVKDGTYKDTVWNMTSDYAVTSSTGTSDNCYAYAPVYLPNGATITKVQILYYDFDHGGKSVYVSFSLTGISFAYTETTGYSMASAWTISNVYLDLINYLTDDTISNATISSAHRYTLRIYWDPTGFSDNLRFYGARIRYTIDTLTP